jgi:2,4-dienoyl-CoA reductase-like NADH-dependent reductase (Old Yellow Enzyme family)
VVRAVRAVWPDRAPVLVRLSATDWVDGGVTVEDSVQVARWLVEDGADLIDCSSGGAIPGVRIPVGPGSQVPLAARIRGGAEVATAAVGMLTEPAQAETVLTTGAADLILQARASLRDPYWPRRAAAALGVPEALPAPDPYARGW